MRPWAVPVRVVLNGEPVGVASGVTVGELVDSFERGRRGIAVAVNGDVVPRAVWDAHRLAEGNDVEILTAAQGG